MIPQNPCRYCEWREHCKERCVERKQYEIDEEQFLIACGDIEKKENKNELWILPV